MACTIAMSRYQIRAPGEVRVRLQASALNRRDLAIVAGRYGGTVFPAIGGSDGAGTIDAVGDGGDSSVIGREVVVYPARAWGDRQEMSGRDFRVLGMPDQGTFADYICVPEADVAPKPAHLDWAEAAAVPLAGLTSWRAVVTQGGIAPGMRVLVTGAGSGTSTFAIRWAALHGADVWVTSGSEEKIANAVALGAKGGISYREPDFARTIRKTAGGFDLIIDSAGGDGVNALLDTLRGAGRYVFFGATLGDPASGINLRSAFGRQLRIQGTTMGSPEEFRAMLAFVEAHGVRPVVDRVLPLAEIADGFRLMQGFAQTGKIVLKHD